MTAAGDRILIGLLPGEVATDQRKRVNLFAIPTTVAIRVRVIEIRTDDFLVSIENSVVILVAGQSRGQAIRAETRSRISGLLRRA